MTMRDKIICLAAKYKTLNFLAQTINVYYHFGSSLKQLLVGGPFKKTATQEIRVSALISCRL